MSEQGINVESGELYSRDDFNKLSLSDTGIKCIRRCVSTIKDIPLGNQVLLAVHHKESILTIINATKDTKVTPYKFEVAGCGSDTRYVSLGDVVILDPYATLRPLFVSENELSFAKQQKKYSQIRKDGLNADVPTRQLDEGFKVEKIEIVEYCTIDEGHILTVRKASDFVEDNKQEFAEATPTISLTTESD